MHHPCNFRAVRNPGKAIQPSLFKVVVEESTQLPEGSACLMFMPVAVPCLHVWSACCLPQGLVVRVAPPSHCFLSSTGHGSHLPLLGLTCGLWVLQMGVKGIGVPSTCYKTSVPECIPSHLGLQGNDRVDKGVVHVDASLSPCVGGPRDGGHFGGVRPRRDMPF